MGEDLRGNGLGRANRKERRRSMGARKTYEAIEKSVMEKTGLKKPVAWGEEYRALIEKKTKPWFYRKFLSRTALALARLPTLKRIMIASLFGGGELGIVLVRPEMYSYADEVKRWLGGLGCKIVFEKTLTVDKTSSWKLYWEEMDKYDFFYPYGIVLQSGPSRAIVFRHLPIEEYKKKSKFLKRLREMAPGKYKKMLEKISRGGTQDAFNAIIKGHEYEPHTLRRVVYRRIGKSVIKKMDGGSQAMDPFGYFAKMGEGIRSEMFRGVHTADNLERLKMDADALFTKADLEKIARKATP